MLAEFEIQREAPPCEDSEPDYFQPPEALGGWFFPVEGCDMERVNLPNFYHLGKAIHRLTPIKIGDDLTATQQLDNFIWVRGWLRSFLEATAEMTFPHTHEAANMLLRSTDEYLGMVQDALELKDFKAAFDRDYVTKLKRQIREFELFLERESQRINAFSVPRKGIYDTQALIEHAEDSLPSDVKSRLDGLTVYDIQQAGKCLAFDVPTAAGIHILKAVESLIRAYHAKVTGKTLAVKSRNWGAYIRELNTSGADQKVTAYLQHIKDFYRNPIMHPEVQLAPDEAFSLFTASSGAIVQLDAAIEAWP